jgi:hypothetical protein
MSFLNVVQKRKRKSRVLGRVKIARREQFDDLDLDSKVEFIRNLFQVRMMHVQEMVDENVAALVTATFPIFTWRDRKCQQGH